MSNKTKPKPRVMWANYYPEIVCCSTSRKSCRVRADTRFTNQVVRIAVIPLDDIEALVERAALALLNLERRNDSMRPRKRLDVFPKTTVEFYRERAAVALTAAGIPCKQRRARK